MLTWWHGYYFCYTDLFQLFPHLMCFCLTLSLGNNHRKGKKKGASLVLPTGRPYINLKLSGVFWTGEFLMRIMYLARSDRQTFVHYFRQYKSLNKNFVISFLFFSYLKIKCNINLVKFKSWHYWEKKQI
jgi:hypothetical protein